MSRLVKLPSGMIFDLDRVVWSPQDRTRIGQTLLTLTGMPPDVALVLDNVDVEALVIAGLITELKAKPKVQV